MHAHKRMQDDRPPRRRCNVKARQASDGSLHDSMRGCLWTEWIRVIRIILMRQVVVLVARS